MRFFFAPTVLEEIYITSSGFTRQVVRLANYTVCLECYEEIPKGCIMYRLRGNGSEKIWAYVCKECALDTRGSSIQAALEKYTCSEDALCRAWHLTKDVR